MCAYGVRHKRSGGGTSRYRRQPGKRASAVNVISRIRRRRQINRQDRAIARAMQAAPTQAMRDEIAFFAQRQPF